MKRLFVIMACFIFLCSCSVDNNDLFPVVSETNSETDNMPEVGYRTISAAEAREIMLSGEDFILLDVRTEKEYRQNE